MQSLVTIARAVRHAPGLEKLDGLWNVVRTPYRKVLAVRGAPFVLGGRYHLRLPASISDQDWNRYELEAAAVFGDWVTEHPHSVVLDVGAGFGVYAALALSCSEECRVIAMDSDIASLRASRITTQSLRPGRRLQLVYGLVGEASSCTMDLSSVLQDTEQRIAALDSAARPTFVCLGDEDTALIPTRRLDDFAEEFPATTPALIKIDIEGAELLALRGAEQWLRRPHTDVLLSLHPQYLGPRYGHTPEEVLGFLRDRGYATRFIASDHEEHWWCSRKSA